MSMNEITMRMRDRVDERVRALTIGVFSSVIKMTPVDTGRAKGNWQCTIGQPASGEVTRLGESGSLMEVVDVTPRSAGGICYLTNNLPYIQKLEYGHSQQAPAGMVRVSLQRFSGLAS